MKNLKALFVLTTFMFTSIVPPQGWAQALEAKPNTAIISAVGLMPEPGTSVSLSVGFDLAHFKGMVIDPNDPFKFDFIVHQGDEPLTDFQKHQEYTKLVRYFLAALAVPDTDQWVNLSPYEKDRIIAGDFGKTTMGRDLLAQDYLLKQLSSSLTNPETSLGSKFWNKIYERVYQQFGTKNVPLNSFNKVWIVPDRAVIYEKGNMVYVISSHLKVMTEADYLAMKKHLVDQEMDEKGKAVNISNQVMRQVIIPAIEQEVNEGKNFAPLRQVFSGMLLAAWYKRALKESILARLYANKGKVRGIDQDPRSNEKIYQDYLKAYKKGVYNMIKEEADPVTQEVIPRKYFSGGTVGYKDYAQIVRQGAEVEYEKDFAEQSSKLVMVSGILKSIKERVKHVTGNQKRLAALLAGAISVVNANADSVTLAWSPPVPGTNATNNAVGFNMYSGTVPGVYTNKLVVGNATNVTVNGLQDNVEYYFAVKAYNAAGVESAYSAPLPYMIPNISVNPGTQVVQLTGLPWGEVMTATSSDTTTIPNVTINSSEEMTLSSVNNSGTAKTVTITLFNNNIVYEHITVTVSPGPVFTFSNFAVTNINKTSYSSFNISENGGSLALYQTVIQATTNMNNLNGWFPVGTNNIPVNTTIKFIDPNLPNQPTKFYRTQFNSSSLNETTSGNLASTGRKDPFKKEENSADSAQMAKSGIGFVESKNIIKKSVKSLAGKWKRRAGVLAVAAVALNVHAQYNSVTMAWNPSAPGTNITNTPVGYIINWGPVSSGVLTNMVNVGNATNATINGLLYNVWYNIQVTSYDSLGIASSNSPVVPYIIPEINVNPGTQVVQLTGIPSGVVMTATSNDTNTIPNPTVNSAGQMSFTSVNNTGAVKTEELNLYENSVFCEHIIVGVNPAPKFVLSNFVATKTNGTNYSSFNITENGGSLILYQTLIQARTNLNNLNGWYPVGTTNVPVNTTIKFTDPNPNFPNQKMKFYRTQFNSSSIDTRSKEKDSAQLVKGGIDFAGSNLDMQIKRDGSGVVLPMSQQNLDNLRIDGLIPVILKIKPVESMLLFSKIIEEN